MSQKNTFHLNCHMTGRKEKNDVNERKQEIKQGRKEYFLLFFLPPTLIQVFSGLRASENFDLMEVTVWLQYRLWPHELTYMYQPLEPRGALFHHAGGVCL